MSRDRRVNAEGESVVTNPFEDPDANYLVLVNDEGQHSLWPIFADVPDGWQAIFGEAGREECLEFIEENWTDMRPKSLIRDMEDSVAAKESDGSTENGTQKEKRAPTKGKKINTKN